MTPPAAEAPRHIPDFYRPIIHVRLAIIPHVTPPLAPRHDTILIYLGIRQVWQIAVADIHLFYLLGAMLAHGYNSIISSLPVFAKYTFWSWCRYLICLRDVAPISTRSKVL